MEEKRPLVTIIVRTKDRPKLLRKALESISAQTYRPIEAVVVNDGGCELDVEDLKDVLSDVAMNYIRLNKNTGRANAGNTGIENSSGNYVGFLDDDDELYPDHIALLVSLLEQFDYKVVYSDVHIANIVFDPDSRGLIVTDKRVFESKEFSFNELILDNYMPLMSLLFSRDILRDVGGFDDTFDLYEDWDMLIRIAATCPFYHLRKTTACYKQWSATAQIAQTSSSAHKADDAHSQVISKHKEKITADIITGLVQGKRRLKEKEGIIETLERKTAGLERELREKLNEKETVISDFERIRKDFESRQAGLEKTVSEKEWAIVNLERTVREKDAMLELIYNSGGWRALMVYYRVRDWFLPVNSRRRTLLKTMLKILRDPIKLLKTLNAMNMRKFFYYLKNADPSVLEEKINRKLFTEAGKEISPVADSCFCLDAGEDCLEANSVLVMGTWGEKTGSDRLSFSRDQLVKGLSELACSVSFLDHCDNVEEYFKRKGPKPQFIIGRGAGYCFENFSFARAYSPGSRLIYHAQNADDNELMKELVNAAVADLVIVDSDNIKEIFLEGDTSLRIEVVLDSASLKEALEKVTYSDEEKKDEVSSLEIAEASVGTIKETAQSESPAGPAGSDIKKGNVLVLGIYLADQENAIEHVVFQMGSSKRYNVTQKWIALRGNPPSENVAKVTVLKVASPLPKNLLLNKILSGEQLQTYDYVIICDDDIRLPGGFVDDFLDLQDRYNFSVAQPARTHNSYIDHFIVERLEGLKARHTRFVEVGPLMSVRRDIVPFILPFDESIPMGWGFDYALPCIAEKHGLRIGIIDATPVDHSMRKPMLNYKYEEAKRAMEAYLSRVPHLSVDEAFRILESYD